MTVSNWDFDTTSADIVFKYDADFLGLFGASRLRIPQNFRFRM